MILFPMNPTWFALKFITTLRNHEKCLYKPSIRQAIAICSLIMARFLNRGECKVEDFVEIAVVTSPLENQVLARKIATQLLTYAEMIEKGHGTDVFSPNMLLLGEKALDLLNDLDENYNDLDDIFDDLEFLRNYQEELEDFDLEKFEAFMDNNLFETNRNDLETEPYKTALDIIQNHGGMDVQNMKDLDSLVSMARKILSEKINHLEPSNVLDAKNLNMLQDIIENSQLEREKMLARIALKEDEKVRWLDKEKKKFNGLLDEIIQNLSNLKAQFLTKHDKVKKEFPQPEMGEFYNLEELDNLISYANKQKKDDALFTNRTQLEDTRNFLDQFISLKKKEKENVKALYLKEENEREKSKLKKELEKTEQLISAAEAQEEIINKKKEQPIENKNQLLNKIEESLTKDFNGTIQDTGFFFKSEIIDNQTKEELKNGIKKSLIQQNRTVNDLFNASTTLGTRFEFNDEEVK
ncbi:MAG: hypothetical protein ACTSYC_07935, partial [Promethearchaeota archaeon]